LHRNLSRTVHYGSRLANSLTIKRVSQHPLLSHQFSELYTRHESMLCCNDRGPVLAITTRQQQQQRNSHCDSHCEHGCCPGCGGIRRGVSTNSTLLQINHEIGSILRTRRRRKEDNGSKRAQNSRHSVIALRGQCFNKWYIVLNKGIGIWTKRKVLVGNNRVVFHHC
jgi:hypothetical protein